MGCILTTHITKALPKGDHFIYRMTQEMMRRKELVMQRIKYELRHLGTWQRASNPGFPRRGLLIFISLLHRLY